VPGRETLPLLKDHRELLVVLVTGCVGVRVLVRVGTVTVVLVGVGVEV
jgi:hypothetical protein